ncbi:MAG: hypothetical protein JW833_14430 [Prolixibacteraceae bacterium]|nr:hypothetical protein [Prolixibacteraceae bacterium]
MESKFDMNQWGYIKDKLREKYPELTNADLNWGHLLRDDLLQNISTKLGKTKKDLLDVIESFDYSSIR